MLHSRKELETGSTLYIKHYSKELSDRKLSAPLKNCLIIHSFIRYVIHSAPLKISTSNFASLSYFLAVATCHEPELLFTSLLTSFNGPKTHSSISQTTQLGKKFQLVM